MCVSVYSYQSLESHNVKLVAVSVFRLRRFYNSGHGYLYAGGRRLVNVCVRVYVEKYSTDFVNFFNLSILHVEVDNNPAMAVKEIEGRGREWYRHEEENYQMEKGRDI